MTKLIMQPYAIKGYCTLTFILILIGANRAQGQVPDDFKSNLISVLGGHVNLHLEPGTYTIIKTEQLLETYASVFNVGSVTGTSGFKLNQNSNLKFYATSVENPVCNDGGISTWRLIESFTDKITNGQWMESKWEVHGGGYWYFVSLASHKERNHFYKFIFFYVENRLAFCLYEYSTDVKQTCDKSEPMNYFSSVCANSHPSRYSGPNRK